MAVIAQDDAGEDALSNPLILLGRRLAKELAKLRESISQVLDFVWRRSAKVGEEENPHTPYARARGKTSRRASRFGRCVRGER
ncbi:MAG: hypothetical protein KGK33_09000 [Hyphomicrobiales bacterium]|nr:hypothetical protein [Hyphomicrobiales bacterium]